MRSMAESGVGGLVAVGGGRRVRRRGVNVGVGDGGRRGWGVVWEDGARCEVMRDWAAVRAVGEGGGSMSVGGLGLGVWRGEDGGGKGMVHGRESWEAVISGIGMEGWRMDCRRVVKDWDSLGVGF